MAAWRAGGQKPAEMFTPDPPASLAYLLQWFQQLAASREMGMSAPSAMGWLQIQAWAQLMGHTLAPWQVEALCTLDSLWRAAWTKGRPAKT